MTAETWNHKFVRSILPWAVAGIFFLLYLATLNHWITTASLSIVAKVSGLDWRHDYIAPLQFIFLRPFGLLPASLHPIALNLFSAVTAALTLALLARSVRLLPHNRTRDQRQRESDFYGVLSLPQAWLPPVVAVFLCGLQLTFWENATAISGEMIDLLIFAYCIRCLLEYRVSKNEKWLTKLALVYGLGVTNNWAMIAYFPLFLAALIWMKGLAFFQWRFLGKMLAVGAAGLLLYLFLPAVDALSEHPSGSFWEVLKTNWRFQKSMTWQNPFCRSGDLRLDLFRLALTSLLPVLLISIRWPSFQGDISPASDLLTTFMLRFLHLVFLVFTLWLFLDPPFSGRVLGRGYIPFLSFYYLAALVAGYLCGYVLLVFGRRTEQVWQAFSPSFSPFAKVLVVLMWGVAAAIPVTLVWKNWSQIRTTNGPEMRRFAHLMAQSLPEKGAVILSDDSVRLFLLKALYQQTGRSDGNLLLETTALPYPTYHRELLSAYPGFTSNLFPSNTPPESITAAVAMDYVRRLSQKHRLFYLHPSFGYYFEIFYPRPLGLIWELQRYQPGEITPPPLTTNEIAANEKFWRELKPTLLATIPALRKQNRDMNWLGMNYARALNSWGVDLQRTRRWDEAKVHFADALSLNPENTAAFMNQRFNMLQRGEIQTNSVEVMKEIEKRLGQYRSWESAMILNGPFDGMQSCYRIGQEFLAGGNSRQALGLFLRTLEISPEQKAARLAVISTYVESRLPDSALEQIQILRGQPGELPAEAEWSLLELESRAYALKNDLPTAEKCLLALRTKRTDDGYADRLLLQFYLESNRPEDALRITEAQLKSDPQDANARLNQSVVLMQMKHYAQAVTVLDELLKRVPNSFPALMNRALALLTLGKYAEAKRDYETLEQIPSERVFMAYRGLGEIAEKTGQKKETIRQFQRYLAAAPSNTPESQQIKERLKKLQEESGGK